MYFALAGALGHTAEDARLASYFWPACFGETLLIIGIPLTAGFGIKRVLAEDRARRRVEADCCVSCGYNLTSNVSGCCPECGALREAGRRMSYSVPVPNWIFALVAGLCLLTGVAIYEMIQSGTPLFWWWR